MNKFPFLDEPEQQNLNEVVRRATRKPLPKRFYEHAEAVPEDRQYVLKLDGRTARTPARNVIALPNHELAEAVANEWNAQGAEINPDAMPLTRIANSAIDAVSLSREAVLDDLERYARSDLILYRSDGPERLVAAQNEAWNPILAWSEQKLGGRFVLALGVIHAEQPPEAVLAVRRTVEAFASPFQLAALHVMTTLSGSVLIALAHVLGQLGLDEAWRAAHVDELYQESVWGRDDEALARRQMRERDFRAASRLFLSLSDD